MEFFELTPEGFVGEAENETLAPLSSRAGFVAARDRIPSDPLDASWDYHLTYPFVAFALTVTLVLGGD